MPESDQFFLDQKPFDAFSKRLRAFAASDLVTMMKGADEAQLLAAADMRAAMKSKLLDLNRRPLFDRIMMLAARWKVALKGVDEEAIRAAIPARHNIVHRGYYYQPSRTGRDQADLWDHVLIARELAIRFVLTAIGYRGNYLSFRGGQHDVAFPPE